jgi:hypothetical protein
MHCRRNPGRNQLGPAMSSEQPNSRVSGRETARLEAKANLFLALYSHASHDLERVRAEADRLRGELTQAHTAREHARMEFERVLGETRRQLDLQTERTAQLQEQHDAVLNSTSWRMTAPIRAVTRLKTGQ